MGSIQLSDILLFINIIGGIVICVANLIDYFKHPDISMRWLKLAYVVAGLWCSAAYFALFFITDEQYMFFSTTWIRPLVALMVTIMVIDSVKHSETLYLPDIIRNAFGKFKKNKRRKNDHS